MSKPAKRAPMGGQPREYQALKDGKPMPNRHQTEQAALDEVVEHPWQMCSILQLVYSAGSWHTEGIVARYFKARNGTIHQMGKTSHTHPVALTEGKQK